MSDTYSAPAAPAPAPAPAAPAPVANEVAVDVHPVSSPTPIGAQTPSKSVSQQRQDSIEKAFAKAREPRETHIAREDGRQRPLGPAQARMGHNNPPEPMQKERPIDLRKRPTAETGQPGAQEAAGSARPARAAEPGGQRQTQPAGSQRPAPAHPPLPATAPYREAPRRMDARAQADWAGAPESVRGAVHRMHQEFGQFYQRAKPDMDAMRELRPFYDLARSQGTSLARAVNNYWNMEQKLRGDPLAGLDVIVHNLNLRTPDGQQISFRDICHYVATMSPDQLRQVSSRNVQGAHNLQLGELTQQVSALARSMQEMQYRREYTRRYRQTRRGVDRFAETHPRVDELGEVIVAELRSGHNLETAYRRADLLHPATAAAQTRARTTAQTRPTDRSIHGAPNGSSPHANGRSPPRAGKERTLDDSIADAVRKVRGAL